MLEPADLLLLDEPTNDLDIDTLDVLEESLLEFPGALVLVTHDRYLLDRVSTDILALDGEGGAQRYADYAQWEGARGRGAASSAASSATSAAPSAPPSSGGAPKPAPERPRRLGYHEQREWERMEDAILEAEEYLARCRRLAEDPAIAADHQALLERTAALGDAQSEVDRLFARWAELEAKVKA
jgi:ATP-binding cassette subfamily F protein uup